MVVNLVKGVNSNMAKSITVDFPDGKVFGVY